MFLLGTGTNAAYVEQLSSAKKITNLPTNVSSVVINTEWGAFGEHGCIDEYLTEFDRMVDTDSLNPGHQTYVISKLFINDFNDSFL